MCNPLLIAMGVTTALQVHQGEQQRKATNTANDMARDSAKRTAQLTEEATNKANAKAPDTSALLASNASAGRAGNASTMLTGPQGVDTSQLTLGKNTLLGR
jgi:hypothetical protein